MERFKCRQLDHSSVKLLCSILLFKNIYLLNPHKNLMKWILSCSVQSRPTVCDPANHSMPGLPAHHQLLESTQTHIHCVVMPTNPLILCCPLLLLPSIFPSIRVFSNESGLHIRWPKYWSFSLNISPSNEHLGLISLQSRGLSRDLPQHHSSKASILQHSAFFIVQLSHPYMTTGKTLALTRLE